MSYGYFQFGPEAEQPKHPFPLECDRAHAITKCLKTEGDAYWIFTVTQDFSLSATIKEGGAFVVLRGKESNRGHFKTVERHWDDEFRDCFVCWSNNPRLRWVIGINAYDVEGRAERASA